MRNDEAKKKVINALKFDNRNENVYQSIKFY